VRVEVQARRDPDSLPSAPGPAPAAAAAAAPSRRLRRAGGCREEDAGPRAPGAPPGSRERPGMAPAARSGTSSWQRGHTRHAKPNGAASQSPRCPYGNPDQAPRPETRPAGSSRPSGGSRHGKPRKRLQRQQPRDRQQPQQQQQQKQWTDTASRAHSGAPSAKSGGTLGAQGPPWRRPRSSTAGSAHRGGGGTRAAPPTPDRGTSRRPLLPPGIRHGLKGGAHTPPTRPPPPGSSQSPGGGAHNGPVAPLLPT
jgi:hypothetical protein